MNDIQLQVDDAIIKGSDILAAIDYVVGNLRETNDLSQAEAALKSLKGIEDVSGMGIARLLYGVQGWWEETDQDELTEDSFEDWAYGVDVSFNPIYIKRCVAIFRYESDGTFSERINDLPIKCKHPIASHLDQGYEISNSEWKQLERSTSEPETRAILREIKGKPPRKSALIPVMERDGTINVWCDGEQEFVGYFDLNSESEAVQKIINRFLKNTGVTIK